MITKFLKYIPEDQHAEFLNCFSYQTVNTLNELLQLDSKALSSILDVRFSCKEELGATCFISGVDSYQLGVMGLINTLLPSTQKVFPVYFKKPPSLGGDTSLSMFVLKEIKNEEE